MSSCASNIFLRVAFALCLGVSACSRSGLGVDTLGAIGASVDASLPRTATAIPPNVMQARADKIDLLFVIDNSGSMRDKQLILSRAVPDLVDRLVNPLCVDPATLVPSAIQPKSALAACPDGALREFNSVQDLHIGVVSTSLGGVGAGSCGVGSSANSSNDHAHLLPPRGATPGPRPFLVWDPAQLSSPPGEKDPDKLRAAVRNLVTLGEGGCPYEMPLEGMYRFLIEPEPYESVELADCGTGSAPETCAVQEGMDAELLAQRRSFLRYDSLVAIIVLTDENDCSLTAGGNSFHVFDAIGSVARATSSCTRRDDRCCRSCDDPAPAGCPDDPDCARGPYQRTEDSGLLRCFDQKGRLGRDYLYPVSRYVDGLTGKRVPSRNGALVANPLFVDPQGKVAERDPSLVFIAAVVGVPWQDLAVDASDSQRLELKSPEQMQADGTWALILGDRTRGIAPRDPLMIETTDERSGVQPIIGAPLAPSSATSPVANPINGHEIALGTAPMEPQYACIFDLPEPEQGAIDCTSAFTGGKRAICQADDGSYGTTQFRGKSYPGVRELEVLRGVGNNAIPASICVRNLFDETREDYGYRPVLRQILDRLRVGLN